MKKINLFTMLSAAIALTFTSCSDVEDFNAEGVSRTITITAENPDVENSTRTEVGLEGTTIVPMWSAGDKITLISEANKQFSCSRDGSEPAKTSSFSKGGINDGTYKTIFKESYIYYSNNKEQSTLPGDILFRYVVDNELIINSKNKIYGDFMYGTPVTIDANTQSVSTRFKRFVSVIKLSVTDPANSLAEGSIITSIEIDSDDKLGGLYCDVYGKDEKINKSVKEGSNGKLTLQFQGFKENSYAEENRGIIAKEFENIYFAVAPMKLNEGQKITFTINAVDKSNITLPAITKTITADSKGIEFEEGKLHAVNLSISEGGTNPEGLVTTAVGQIKPEMIDKAIINNNTVKVSGPINGTDLGNIIGWIADDRVSIVDLRDANIEGNTLAYKMILYQVSLGGKELTVYLPNSLEKIEADAIKLQQYSGNTTLVVGSNTKTIAPNAITLIPQGSIKILSTPENSMISDSFADTGRKPERVELYLHKSWEGDSSVDLTGKTWKGITFGNITFCDDNGNPIQ